MGRLVGGVFSDVVVARGKGWWRNFRCCGCEGAGVLGKVFSVFVVVRGREC